jgi:protein associated with RNAse G/E
MVPRQGYRVQSKSFDGRSCWEWDAEFVARAPSLLVLRCATGGRITSDERTYLWPEDTLQFYWSDRWYNIRAALRDGEPYFFSCNVAMPASFSDGRVEYVDLDLELAINDGFSQDLAGEDDFKRNATGMHYPPDVIRRAYEAVEELRGLVHAGRPPFSNYEALLPKVMR